MWRKVPSHSRQLHSDGQDDLNRNEGRGLRHILFSSLAPSTSISIRVQKIKNSLAEDVSINQSEIPDLHAARNS